MTGSAAANQLGAATAALAVVDWLAIAAIVTVNAVSVSARYRPAGRVTGRRG